MIQPRICVVGSSNLDLVSYVPRLPRLGETLHGSRFQMGFGGKGANQAVMAAKLGGQVAMVTKLGEDLFGDNTRSNFQRWGIDIRHVLTTGLASSGVASIAVGPGGENSITIVAGANNLLTESDIEAAQPAIASAQLLVCQLEIPVETTLAALRLAHQSGVRTILNPAPARPDLPDEIYPYSDVFCPNETEAELLSGRKVGTAQDAEAAAQILLERGAKAVILTLGDRGSLLLTANETTHVPGSPARPVDTTGAGDAYVGSLAYFWAAGLPLREAMRRASIIAARSVEAPGTQTSFPDAADLPPELLR